MAKFSLDLHRERGREGQVATNHCDEEALGKRATTDGKARARGGVTPCTYPARTNRPAQRAAKGESKPKGWPPGHSPHRETGQPGPTRTTRTGLTADARQWAVSQAARTSRAIPRHSSAGTRHMVAPARPKPVTHADPAPQQLRFLPDIRRKVSWGYVQKEHVAALKEESRCVLARRPDSQAPRTPQRGLRQAPPGTLWLTSPSRGTYHRTLSDHTEGSPASRTDPGPHSGSGASGHSPSLGQEGTP